MSEVSEEGVVVLSIVFIVCSTFSFAFFWHHGGPVFIRALCASRRMGLRDKGPNPKWCCPACETDLRVGIDEDGNAVDYCWRCEAIVDGEVDYDPDDEADIPTKKSETSATGSSASILPFKGSDTKKK